MTRLTFLAALGLCLIASTTLHGQQWLIDTTFRVDIQERGVFDMLPIENGNLLLSGNFELEWESFRRGSVKVNTNGEIDPSFPPFPLTNGGGTLTPWQDKIYVGVGQSVRRLLGNGYVDTTFVEPNSGVYFVSVQGGDHHVFPDGSVLISGAHLLNDTVRGFNGLYTLVWLTNTGYLDTTRIHRWSNGVTDDFEALENGQFLVDGTGSTYEGQPVGRIFRINADGSLDPTLQSGINWGAIRSFLPLPDGRFYASGIYRKAGFPDDTLRVARFLPNGELDQTFVAPHFAYYGQPNPLNLGPSVNKIQFTENGNIMVMGNFQLADGVFRKGICVVDTTGALLDDFSNIGVGRYYWMNIPYAYVEGFLRIASDTAYIHGSYHGCSDGTTNDTLQRFVTRLYRPDSTTSVQEESPQDAFTLYPNPAHGKVELRMAHPPVGTGRVRIYDPSGRQVLERSVSNAATQLDVAPLANGIYLVELEQDGQRIGAARLAVQH